MDINKTLTELRTELNTLVENLHPAVKVVSAAAKYAELSRLHADAVIKNAENAVNTVAQNANRAIELSLNEIQDLPITVKKELDAHLENLEHVEKEAWLRQNKLLGDLQDSTEKSIQEVKTIAQQNLTDSRKETQEALILVKSQLSDAIKNIQLIVSDEMAIVKDDMVKILHEIPLFVQKAEQLVQKIDSVNFPQRLDKMDTNITALNIGFQTSQQKLENLEQTFRAESSRTTEDLANLKSSNRTLLILLTINILVTIGGGAVVLYLLR